MCESRDKRTQEHPTAVGKMSLNIATIEDGKNFNDTTVPDPNSKSTEYFDNALSMTKFGKFNYLMILISGLILTNVLLETLGISFVLPVSECDLNLSMQQRGVLSAIGFAGIITSSHLWGFLADTTGRRNIIRPTLLLGFLVTVLSSFSTNFWMLVVLRYINGFCVSGGSATIYAYLGEFHTSKNRSRAIMCAAFIFGVGAMLMPLLAWLVINQEWKFYVPVIDIWYKPWRCFIVVCGIPGFLCGLSLFKIPESPKYLLGQGEEERALNILQTVYHMNTGKSKDEYPVGHLLEDLDFSMKPKTLRKSEDNNAVMSILRTMWAQTKPLFGREYARITSLICIIQFWIFVTSNGMYMWFPHILNKVVEFMNENPQERVYICDIVYRTQEASSTVSPLLSNGLDNSTLPHMTCNEKLEIKTFQDSLVLEMLYAVGFAFIGLIINKVGKMLILFVSLFICGVCGIITIFVNIPMIAIYLYLVLLLCGLGINVLSAATVDLYPTRLRAMAVCISLMMGRLGSVVGASVAGALFNNNCEMAFIASGTMLVVSGFLGFFVPTPKNTSGKPTSRRTSIVSMTGN